MDEVKTSKTVKEVFKDYNSNSFVLNAARVIGIDLYKKKNLLEVFIASNKLIDINDVLELEKYMERRFQIQTAKLTIKYKTEKDKEYKTLKIDDPNDKKNQLDYEVVKLDGKTVKKYSLGKIKGDVKVKVSISGVELTGNAATIKSNENSVTIAPASGIDIAIGKKD